MWLNNWTTNIQQGNETIIDQYLQFTKGQFGFYNKELKEFIPTKLNNISLLDIWYTIKGQQWDQNQNKFIYWYWSNEIKSFDETMYFIKFVYWPETTKVLLAKGKYPVIKEVVKWTQWAWLNLCITFLDHNDWLIKEAFLSWTNFISVSDKLKEYSKLDPDNYTKHTYQLVTTTYYTNNKKDANWELIYITMEELIKIQQTTPALWIWYQPRYKVDLVQNKEVVSDEVIEMLKEYENQLDQFHKEKQEYYRKEYDQVQNGTVVYEEKQIDENNYYQPNVQPTEVAQPVQPVQTEATPKRTYTVPPIKTNDEITIEDLPF